MTSGSDDRPLLITGAAGQLGSAVVTACATRGVRAAGLTRAELDIADPAQVARVLEELAPRAIINCAAYTDVDGAETDRDGAIHVNATAVRVLAEAASSRGIHLVQV
ncbi:MAG: dTDP-4-dehydrorhamnose reductase [Thermoleophilia bacterium]|nr:dTDP-4-dehydrorhamnose reductase [Thermoleophilia bacterium]